VGRLLRKLLSSIGGRHAARGLAMFNDPWLFDVVRSAMGPRNTNWGVRGKARRLMTHGLLADQDTERLTPAERMRLLSEPQSIVRVRDQLAANANQMRGTWDDGPSGDNRLSA
jgi:hypothetical protein